MRNPASIHSLATIGPSVKRHSNGVMLMANSGTILGAYWEVGRQLAKPSTIRPQVKICSLVEINDERRSKDRRPNCCLLSISNMYFRSSCDVCLFVCLQLMN